MPIDPDGAVTIPLHAEHVVVGRQRVDTHHVRVSTQTVIDEVLVDETLRHENAQIDIVPINRFVAEVPPVRHEGDLIIVPVIEEVVVVEKRLLLKEEVHIRRVSAAHRHQETVSVRRQEAVFERTAAEPASEPGVEQAFVP